MYVIESPYRGETNPSIPKSDTAFKTRGIITHLLFSNILFVSIFINYNLILI